MSSSEYSDRYLAPVGDEDFLELHDGAIGAHSLMNGMLFARMAFIKDFRILVVVIVIFSHYQYGAPGSPGSLLKAIEEPIGG